MEVLKYPERVSALAALLLVMTAGVGAQNVQLGDFYCVANEAWMRQVRAGEERLFPIRCLHWPQGAKKLIHDDRFPGLFYVAGEGGLHRLLQRGDYMDLETIVPAAEARGLALDSAAGSLYSIVRTTSAGPWQIWRVDTATGAAVALTTCPVLMPTKAMALNSRDGRLYIGSVGELWALDPATLVSAPIALGLLDPGFLPGVPVLNALVVDPVSGDLLAGDRATARLVKFGFGTWQRLTVDPSSPGIASTSNLAVDATGRVHYVKDLASGTTVDLEAMGFDLVPAYSWSLPSSFPAATSPPMTGDTAWAMTIISALPYGCTPNLTAASVTSVGNGSHSPGVSPPWLGWSGVRPWSGNTAFALRVSGAAPGHPVLGMSTPTLGNGPSMLPGGGVIELDLLTMMTWVSLGLNPLLVTPADASGDVRWPMPLPTDPCLVGQTMAFQAITVDPQGLTGLVAPYATSNALLLTFGY